MSESSVSPGSGSGNQRWSRRAADGVRVLAALSVVVGAWRWGPVGGALFVLVLGGTIVPRAVRAPGALDLAYGTALLVAAWAAQLGWYDAVAGLDLLVHAVATGLVAAVAAVALARWGVVGAAPVRRPRAALGLVVVGLAALGAVLWEIGEWYGHTELDPGIHVGYEDTVSDLAAGLLGGVVAGVVLGRRGLPAGDAGGRP